MASSVTYLFFSLLSYANRYKSLNPNAKGVTMCQYTEQLQSWLTELGQRSGSNFSLDEQFRCFLGTDSGTDLMISAGENDSSFYLVSYLASIPAENQVEIFSQALSLNLFQQETRGASIAIDNQSNSLVLCFTKAYENANFQDFLNIVNNIVELSQKLSEQLSTVRASVKEAPPKWEDPLLAIQV